MSFMTIQLNGPFREADERSLPGAYPRSNVCMGDSDLLCSYS